MCIITSQKQGHVLSSCNTNDSALVNRGDQSIIYKWHKLNFGTFMRTKKIVAMYLGVTAAF